RDIEQIENAQLRYYLNGVATIASQFPREADPEQFADWQESQCLRELKGGATFPALQGQQRCNGLACAVACSRSLLTAGKCAPLCAPMRQLKLRREPWPVARCVIAVRCAGRRFFGACP